MATTKKAAEAARSEQDAQAQHEYEQLTKALEVASERAQRWATPVEPAPADDDASDK